jgi:hypothetical protein
VERKLLPRRSSIEVTTIAGFSFLYSALLGREGIETGNVKIKALIDRPLRVDGAGIDFWNLPSQFLITQDASGFQVKVIALPPLAGMKPLPLAPERPFEGERTAWAGSSREYVVACW